MISKIEIDNFKCLRNLNVDLGTINLLTGANGRGKSSCLQTLLLLSQTWRSGQYRLLTPNGEWKTLGNYDDIHNAYHKDEPITIKLYTDEVKENSFELQYSKNTEKESLGVLSSFVVDGNVVVNVEDEEMGELSDDNSEDNVQGKTLSSVNDFAALTQLRRLHYISADRKAAQYKERIDQTTVQLRPDGSNVLNVLGQQDDKMLENVETLLSEIFSGAMLALQKTDTDITLLLNSVSNGNLYRPENVGYGYGYVLQVILACSMAKKGEIVIIENPEAHLHPSAQSKLMAVLIRESMERHFQLFVETHSDHVVNAALLAVKREDSSCTNEDVEMLFFSERKDEDGHTEVKAQNLSITRKGRITNPPRMFCDQYAMDLRELYL